MLVGTDGDEELLDEGAAELLELGDETSTLEDVDEGTEEDVDVGAAELVELDDVG
jgi:hypothetical protein